MAALDMTKGSITGHLIRYSVPLIVGNLFQLAYNAVDSIIAGRFIGKEALAALGTAGPVMNIIILGISGICMGAGVLRGRTAWGTEKGIIDNPFIRPLFFPGCRCLRPVFCQASVKSAPRAGQCS